MSDKLLSVLVLDFLKPEATRRCLASIRAHVKVPHELVLLDNGSGADYPWDLYRDGLCDTLLSVREGRGGGVGQSTLFRYCATPYALFVQQDQEMLYDLDQATFARFTSLLQTEYRCIDLNGDQSGKGIWTDRAHLIDTAFFNSLAPFPDGGPGPLHHLRWNENYLQEVFATRGLKIAHVKPVMFADRGVWSVREVAGGIVRMRTDTKAVWWDKAPTTTYVFPDMTEAEWACSIAGEWRGGTVPERYAAHSFSCWRETDL